MRSRGGVRDRRERHVEVVREVHEQRALAARVVDAAIPRPVVTRRGRENSSIASAISSSVRDLAARRTRRTAPRTRRARRRARRSARSPSPSNASVRPTFNAITGTSSVGGARELRAERRPDADRLQQQREHARGRPVRARTPCSRPSSVTISWPVETMQVEPDAAVVERQRRERGPAVRDERHRARAGCRRASRTRSRAACALEVEEPHAVAAAQRDARVARDRGDALRERRHGRARGLASYSDENVTAERAPAATASLQRLLDPLVRDTEDRQVDGPGEVGDRRVAAVGRGPRRSPDSPGRSRRRIRRAASSTIIWRPSDPSLTLAPTTATDRASSIALEGGPGAGSTRRGHVHYFLAERLVLLGLLNACQPGMPLTPPPPCVAHEPWYRPRDRRAEVGVAGRRAHVEQLVHAQLAVEDVARRSGRGPAPCRTARSPGGRSPRP